MNVSKLFVSGTAAAAVIGAIGFAYAQTTPYSSSGTPQTQNQGTANNPNVQNQSPSNSTGSMNNNNSNTGISNTRPGAAGMATDNTGNMGNERMARADRN